MNPLQNLYELIDILKDEKVYLVYDKLGKRVCVLKERSLKTLELYQRLKKINNPCIPEIFRIVQFDEKVFVVEEFIEGQTLAEFFNYHKFNEKIIANILKQICNGLKILHEEKIIHRDLKPSNIMLTKNNSVKLIDFSISRIEKKYSEFDTDFLGTRGYAPPEQFGFGQTDSRSDIFSLGITFQKLLGENYHGYLKKILRKCTELDPAKRYQNTSELISDIDRKYLYYKLRKIFICTPIIFSVIIYPARTFDLEPPQENENKPVEEKIVEPKIEIPQIKESFSFPAIKFPTQELPQENLPQENLPQNPIKKIPIDPRLSRICTLFLNDKIFDKEISANIWQNWRHKGSIIYFPTDWNLTLKVENKNDSALNVNISVNLAGEEKNFAENIFANQSKNLKIPLGNFSIHNGSFQIKILLNTNDDIKFSWQGNSFGNYKEFTIYLSDFRTWKYKNKIT